MAVAEANISLAIIQHRNFTSAALQASSTLQEANETLIVNTGLYLEAETINKSVNQLFERVQSLIALLVQLRNVEVVVNGTLQNTTEINYSIKSLLVQIKVNPLRTGRWGGGARVGEDVAMCLHAGKGRRRGRGGGLARGECNLTPPTSQALTLEAFSLNESVHLGLAVVSSQLGLGTSLLNATMNASQVG